MIVKRNRPEIIMWTGEPAAVLLHLDDYREMLKRLGDHEALQTLEKAIKPQGEEAA